MPKPQGQTLFISYSHKDQPLIDQFHDHLAALRYQGLLSDWHDRAIKPGSNWAEEIDEKLEEADIVLLMVSPGFVGSDYCMGVELKKALARHGSTCTVVPVAVRDVEWEGFPFYDLQGLPTGLRPVTKWRDRDSAWRDVIRGIRRAVSSRSSEKKREPSDGTGSRRIPGDYVFLNHTSFLRKRKQREFQGRTGVPIPHYDVRVVVDSFHERALDEITRVDYFLPEGYPKQKYTKTRRHRKELFVLKELANGEYLLKADVYFRDQEEPLRLRRFITLWDTGPELV